jgi:hypothetical protein
MIDDDDDDNEEDGNKMEGAESPWLLLRKKTKRQQLKRLLWNITATSVATLWLHVFVLVVALLPWEMKGGAQRVHLFYRYGF